MKRIYIQYRTNGINMKNYLYDDTKNVIQGNVKV